MVCPLAIMWYCWLLHSVSGFVYLVLNYTNLEPFETIITEESEASWNIVFE